MIKPEFVIDTFSESLIIFLSRSNNQGFPSTDTECLCYYLFMLLNVLIKSCYKVNTRFNYISRTNVENRMVSCYSSISRVSERLWYKVTQPAISGSG